jgi:excisionase family DNA binding protein
MAEPPGLADLESVARGVVKHQEHSDSSSVLVPSDDGLHERAFLSRNDVSRTTGASLATVDRWIGRGDLPSSKHGRTRRVARTDLERFLAA